MVDQVLLDNQEKKIRRAEAIWVIALLFFAGSLLFIHLITWLGVAIVAFAAIFISVIVNTTIYRPATLAIARLNIDEWYVNAKISENGQLHYMHDDPEVMLMFCERAKHYGMTCTEPSTLQGGGLRASVRKIA